MKYSIRYVFPRVLLITAVACSVVLGAGCASRRSPAMIQEMAVQQTQAEEPEEKSRAAFEFQATSEKQEEISTPRPFSQSPAVTAEKKTGAEDMKKRDGGMETAATISEVRARIEAASIPRVSEKETRAGSEDGVILNFDSADIYEVIRGLAEHLNINYIIDSGVKGTVTIQTYGNLDADNLWPVFLQILDVNGLTAVKEGQLYRIISMKDAPKLPILSGDQPDGESAAPLQQVVFQIIPLAYADAEDMTKILTPFVSSEGTIAVHGESNTLLVVDRRINILKALELVEVFDADFLDKTGHRYFFLKYAEAEETAKLLDTILGSLETTGKTADCELITIKRLNAILVLSDDTRMFRKIESYLSELDIASDISQRQIYVYSVKNGTAADLAGILNSIFGRATSSDEKTGTAGRDARTEETASIMGPSSPFAQPSGTGTGGDSGGSPEPAGDATGASVGSSSVTGDLKIIADGVRNSLIIEAVPSDYRVVENILAKLDVMPRQVLIEVTVAEITLDDSTSLGVGWDYLDSEESFISTITSGSASDEGLLLQFGETERLKATLTALETNNKTNILASPSILASDNKTASINITTELPYVSSSYDVTGDRDLVTTDVQYRNTGLILDVTPHINENGLVTMTLSNELSEDAGGVDVDKKSYPSYYKRTVNTELVVGNNQTIIIGGLMKETTKKGRTGVPILSALPGIGFLFGKDTETAVKTELMILITPRVMTNLDDVDAVTHSFKSRLNQALQDMILD